MGSYFSIIKGCLDNTEANTALRLTKPSNESELIVLMSERDNEKQRQRIYRQASKNQLNRKFQADGTQRRHRYEPYPKEHIGTKTVKFTDTCYTCTKPEHKSFEYKNKHKILDTCLSAFKGNREITISLCAHCKKTGHTEGNCYFKVEFPN